MSLDFDRLSYRVNPDDTGTRFVKVDIYYDDEFKASVNAESEALLGSPDTVLKRILRNAAGLIKVVMGDTLYEGSDPNLSLVFMDDRSAMDRLIRYLTNKGTFIPAEDTDPENPIDREIEFATWLKATAEGATPQQIVNALTE